MEDERYWVSWALTPAFQIPFQSEKEKEKDAKELILRLQGSGIRLWEEEIRFQSGR